MFNSLKWVSLAGFLLAWEKDRKKTAWFENSLRLVALEAFLLWLVCSLAATFFLYAHVRIPAIDTKILKLLSVAAGLVVLQIRSVTPGVAASYGLLALAGCEIGGGWVAVVQALGLWAAALVLFESLLLGLYDKARLVAVPESVRGMSLRFLLAALLSLALWGLSFMTLQANRIF